MQNSGLGAAVADLPITFSAVTAGAYVVAPNVSTNSQGQASTQVSPQPAAVAW